MNQPPKPPMAWDTQVYQSSPLRQPVLPHSKDSSTNSTSSDNSSLDYDTRSTTPEKWTNEKDPQFHSAGSDVDVTPAAIGLLPDEVYEKSLGWWRSGIRKHLLKSLSWESQVIASLQKTLRTPFLDAYFVNTSSLGTHTFFMIMLPAFCFFGYQDIFQGLLFVLPWGVYLSSWVKDSMCAPRPLTPPVTRLTTGNTHHLEYGFPSTHSTNSVSIALCFFSMLHRLYKSPATTYAPPVGVSEPLIQNATHIVEDVLPEMMISSTTYYISIAVLCIYVFSIVFGRIYTGMHSLTDCTFGVVLGVAIWGIYVFIGDWINLWLRTSGWIAPATIIPATLLLVHRHPEPVDDCPCFEDAIAFMAVVMGEYLTRWFMSQHGYDDTFFVLTMQGKPYGSLTEMWTWWSIAVGKLIVGILAIFAWRIFAKFLLHRILPPIFRFLAQLVTLPHRRYYTPATDYTNVPPDKGLRPIPSVLDLPGMVELEGDSMSTAHSRRQRNNNTATRQIKRTAAGRNGNGVGAGGKAGKMDDAGGPRGLGIANLDSEMGGRGVDVVKHYDADVLTKVFVYCGIGIIASGVMPVVFELIGWGLRVS